MKKSSESSASEMKNTYGTFFFQKIWTFQEMHGISGLLHERLES